MYAAALLFACLLAPAAGIDSFTSHKFLHLLIIIYFIFSSTFKHLGAGDVVYENASTKTSPYHPSTTLRSTVARLATVTAIPLPTPSLLWRWHVAATVARGASVVTVVTSLKAQAIKVKLVLGVLLLGMLCLIMYNSEDGSIILCVLVVVKCLKV